MENFMEKTSKNALQSGVYSRDSVLPWESAAQYEKHRSHILDDLRPRGYLQTSIAADIAQNRWVRQRAQRMTEVAMRRHPFSEVLERTAPRSWDEVLSVVRKHQADNRKLLQKIADSISAIQATAQQLAREVETANLSEAIEEIADGCSQNWERLARVEIAIDLIRDFFVEYSPKHLRKRVLLENALDAQFQKLRARFVIEQEAWRASENLRERETAAGSTGDEMGLAATAKPPSGDGTEGPDLAEMDRDDDTEEVAPGMANDDDDEWTQTPTPQVEGDD
jgi:sucrose-6-phosphate hydrolase SacC (GH32 family)